MAGQRDELDWDHTVQLATFLGSKNAFKFHPYKDKSKPETTNPKPPKRGGVEWQIQLAEMMPPGPGREKAIEAIRKRHGYQSSN